MQAVARLRPSQETMEQAKWAVSQRGDSTLLLMSLGEQTRGHRDKRRRAACGDGQKKNGERGVRGTPATPPAADVLLPSPVYAFVVAAALLVA